jgi:4-diphosphocytidyl-2-C-methyl-D-erythritol kinase
VVTLRAPAKLTLSLRVTGMREDRYHLIDAEMVSLELADMVSITDGDGVEITGPFAAGVPVDDSNLVRRALDVVGRRAHVVVEKNIPPGGGLGGGSTDAAAILRWAGFTDLGAASRIGADVPFCLVGGRARVRGIGELVEPLPPVEREITLVAPPFGVSTPAVYRAWDELASQRGAVAGVAQRGRRAPARPRSAEWPNDLEPAALDVEPRLTEWRERITEACGVRPVLAGSGSTWFVDGSHPDLAAALPDAAAVIVTRTTPAVP